MDLVSIIVGLFFPDAGGANKTAFEKVAANIYMMPLPDLSSPNFRAQYAVMWGLGIIISLVVGFLSATFALGKSMTSVGSSTSVATRLLFFVQVFAVGFLATPALYIIVYMADVLSDSSQTVFGHSHKDTTWLTAIVKMFNPDGGLDYIIKEAIVWLINHEVTVIQLAIPVMVMCTSAAFAFSVLGKGGKSIWKMWWAVILTLIFVKPALAWLFALCAWALSNAPNPGDTSVSLLALFIAMLLPLLMLFVFYKKSDPPIHPMMMAAPGVGSAHVSHQQSGMGKFLAPAAGAMGWMAASHAKNSEAVTNDPSSATPRTPGARRVAAASFTSSKAVTLAGAHPMGAAVLGLGSIALGQSGKRAATKKGPGAVNPPQPPPSAPPQAPLRARPSNPGGNSKPGSPPNPVIRAPHELPTSTRRPSLGRKNTERRSQ